MSEISAKFLSTQTDSRAAGIVNRYQDYNNLSLSTPQKEDDYRLKYAPLLQFGGQAAQTQGING